MFSPSPPEDSTKRRTSHTYLDCDHSPDHVELTERLCKTLYYGNETSTEYPSLPLTEIAVKFFQDAAPRSLGKVDMYLASSMTKHAPMSPCSVMLGILYVKRLKEKNPEYLMQISSAELFLISMMMASKYLYDEGVNEEVFNEDWAIIGMMETAEINQLEQDFLAAIDWRIMVRQHEFNKLLDAIEKKIAFHESFKRGWLSYTDMWTLTQGSFYSDLCKSTGQELAKMFAVGSVAYIAGVLTLLASSVITMSLTTKLTALINQPSTLSLPPYHQLFLSKCDLDTIAFGLDSNLEGLSASQHSPSTPPSLSSLSSLRMAVENLRDNKPNYVVGMNGLGNQISAASPQKLTAQENQSEIETFSWQQEIQRVTETSTSLTADDVDSTISSSESRQSHVDDGTLTPEGVTRLETELGGAPSQQLTETQPTDVNAHLPRSKYATISTALLNLVALFSLKTPVAHELDKEVGHCKHCKRPRHSVSSTTASVVSATASVPGCQNLLTRTGLSTQCSWSRTQSQLRSSKKHVTRNNANSNTENSFLSSIALSSLSNLCNTATISDQLPIFLQNHHSSRLVNSSQPPEKLYQCQSFTNHDLDPPNNRDPLKNPKYAYDKVKEDSWVFKRPRNCSQFTFLSCASMVSSPHLRPPGMTNMIIHPC